VSVARRLAAPPELAALHEAFPDQWPFLLASTTRGGALGRWSMLLRRDPETPPVVAPSASTDGDFLDGFARQFEARRIAQPGELPFEGGWFVYLGYELAGFIEPRLHLPAADDRLPVALAQRCTAALVVDHLADCTWLVAETEAIAAAAGSEIGAAPPSGIAAGLGEVSLNADDGARFCRGVERIRDYILAGDVFQVNLSRAWRGRAPNRPRAAEIYRALAMRNPSPFAGLARLPGGTVLSSSPERLVWVRGERVEVRPIAGTRPRGDSADEDRELSSELLAHPKERAEHIMLIDLERNDLGRICRAGSVEVDELMTVESYAHVHHIVSNIVGRLRPDVSPADVIRAVFPGGTITGCPKVRCMEIIAELETTGRSFYTGSMGYVGRDGRMDLNILIRSMLVDGESIRFRTGAGIVADSIPEAELAETEAKAHGLMRALGHG